MRLVDIDNIGIGKANRDLFNIPEYADGWNEAIKIIKSTPTAFDIDKVIEEVEKITDRISNYCEEIDYHIPKEEQTGYRMLDDIFKLREIVKKKEV